MLKNFNPLKTTSKKHPSESLPLQRSSFWRLQKAQGYYATDSTGPDSTDSPILNCWSCACRIFLHIKQVTSQSACMSGNMRTFGSFLLHLIISKRVHRLKILFKSHWIGTRIKLDIISLRPILFISTLWFWQSNVWQKQVACALSLRKV